MTITTRVQLLVIAVSLTLSLFGALLLRNQSLNLHADSQQVLAETLVRSLQVAIVQDIIDGNTRRVNNVLRDIKKSEAPIEFLYVKYSGNVVAHSFKNDFPEYLTQTDNGDFFTNQKTNVYLSNIYQTENSQIYEYRGVFTPDLDATLHIGLNQSQIKMHLLKSTQYSFLADLVLGLAALLVATSLARRITHPLRALTEHIHSYGGGISPDLSQFENSSTEIKILKTAFEEAIQERNATFSELALSEEDLRITLESIGDAVITTDRNGCVVRMNPVAERLTGWSLNESRGQSLENIFPVIHATTRVKQENPAAKVITTGETIYLSNHTTLIAKDGEERQIAHSAAPIRDDEGQIKGVILVFHDETEQYQLREAARAASKRLHDLVNDMKTMVSIIDTDGSISFVNNTSLKQFGISVEKLLGEKMWATPWFNYDPTIVETIREDCIKASRGEDISHEVQIATPGGLTWIDFSIHPVFDDRGMVEQIVVEAKDINQSKALDAKLYDSLQRIKLYHEQAPIATIDWDLDYKIVNWNSTAETIFGFKAEEAIGNSFELIVPEEAMGLVNQLAEDLIAKTGGTMSINENITKLGERIICEWHNRSIVNNNGDVIGVSSLVIDVSERYRSQQALQNKEKEQREMLDTMVDGVARANESGSILSFNRAAEELFGYKIEEVIGRPFSELLDRASAKQFTDLFSNISQEKKLAKKKIVEVVAIRKDSSQFQLNLSIAELPHDVDSHRQFVISCHDLTQLKLQEEQLRRAQKMDALGMLTGGIAHDYNNMLGIILGYSELLTSALHDQPKLSHYAQEIHRASERGANLTKKLLSFSRQKKTDETILDVNTLLRGEQHMLEKTLTARIELVFDLGKDLWPVTLDSSDLEDAVINISINALHAMQERGRLTIKTQNSVLKGSESRKLQVPDGKYVQLSFTDTGCGMRTDSMSKIFDPFYSTKGEKGTGLGLSQVYGFVQRSGGGIKVYSELGKGTQLDLFFPKFNPENEVEKVIAKEEPENFTGNETILLVDDEPALLEVTSEILEDNGYKVFCANSGVEALEILAIQPVDLMVTDVIMPEMDGYELANIVQKKYPDTKIQLASGFSDNRHASLLDDSLKKSILNKPYKSGVILKRVREVLDRDCR